MMRWIVPQQEVAVDQPQPGDTEDPEEPEPEDQDPSAPEGDDPDAADPTSTEDDGEEPAVSPVAEEPVAQQIVSLGSLAADSPYRLLVTLNNRGATVERIELAQRRKTGQFRFSQLDRKGAYLGHLGLRDEPSGGCRIGVVGAGTPASEAKPEDPSLGIGLRVGDVIRQLDDQPVDSSLDVRLFLERTEPGEQIRVTVARAGDDDSADQQVLTTTLTNQPLSIIRPENNQHASTNNPDPFSFMMALERIGEKQIARGSDEISKLNSLSLRRANWEVNQVDERTVEFRRRLSSDSLQQIDLDGELEIVKRYRLAQLGEGEAFPDAYHLTLDVEIRNLGDSAQKIAYRLDGANGLPLEGWWYSNKIHPSKFSGVGARDIVWSTPESGHRLLGCPKIYNDAKEAVEKGLPPTLTLADIEGDQVLDYIGVDAQYFTVALLPSANESGEAPSFQQAMAMPAGQLGEKKKTWVKTTNTSFRLISADREVQPGESVTQRFTIFAGPKRLDLLQQYGLDDCIAYGWFWWIAKPLSKILHFFEWLPLVNYGLAIILLTVLVRSAMTPLSRKAAKNAQMMQELAPEMKRIAEKYKNDMEKRASAQRELFAKHNYNPFGGCLLMFIQLPIFIGLYRSLSVDIELLQAPLIPGLDWCSNLAGPDMLFYWEPYLWEFFANPGTGWLGPFFNVLPIITIVLFLLQQKMFMPPATDEQTRMQQSMMKYMMIFMGVLFFRVPSGLCVYFIASSLWGITERKLLPPPTLAGQSAKPDKRAREESEAKKARIKKRKR
jgi:YidC/Oxa1 family membrane protein insertase